MTLAGNIAATDAAIAAAWRRVEQFDEAAVAARALGKDEQARQLRDGCEAAIAEARRLEAYAADLPVDSENDARAAIRLIVAGLDALQFEFDGDPTFNRTARLASSLNRWLHR
jgi:hypothetical protein